MTVKESKYIKFGRNNIGDTVYNYVAYDEVNDVVLCIKFSPTFESDLPAEITITAPGNYSYDSTTHTELTPKEFWTVYKHAVLKQYEYSTVNAAKYVSTTIN